MSAFFGKKRLISFFLLTFLSLMCIAFFTFTAFSERGLQDETKRTIQIINPNPNFSLRLRLDKGIGSTYAVGEKIKVYFKSSKDAYVVLFGYDNQGNIKLLFPNKYQKNSYVKAERQYQIEGVIETGTPPGIEYVQGFATLKPVIMTRELEKRIEEEYLPTINRGLSLFTARIKGILNSLPSNQWISSDIVHYRVIAESARYGQLRINSSPDQAEVFLDDNYIGVTPLVYNQVPADVHTIRIEHPDYYPWRKTIQVQPDRTTAIEADLQLKTNYGAISIRCNENNANIYLDGQYRGQTDKDRSILLDRISQGYHDVRISLDGYQDWERNVKVSAQETVYLSVFLDKLEQRGNLEINANINGAKVYLNGLYKGETSIQNNLVIRNLAEGSYELRISKKGYLDYIETIRIYANHTRRVSVNLETEYNEKGSLAVYCNESMAKIFINGIYKARTEGDQAQVLSGLKEGNYEITIIKDGYHTWLEEVWIYPGETSSVFADLRKVEE